MKRVLTATTALVGMGFAASAAQAEEPISLGLSGFMNAYYSTGGQDDDLGSDDDVRGHFQDATINFIGSTVLDNGLEVGVRFELESFGHPEDEQFIYFKGNFGTLTAGAHNSAAYNMGWLASGHHYTAGAPINTGWINYLIAAGFATGGNSFDFREPGVSTFLDTHNDSNTVSYETPRFAGFKFGASWTPEPNVSVSGGGQFGPADTDEGFHDAFSFAANFTRSFEGVTVNAAGGINVAPNDTSGPDNGEDVKQYTGGLNIAFGGFNIGGNIGVQDSDGANDGTNSTGNFATTDGEAYSAGIGYTTGPWSFAGEWMKTEVEGDVTGAGSDGEDELTALKGAVEYALGPGIAVNATIGYAEWEDEAGGEIQGTSGIIGTTVTF